MITFSSSLASPTSRCFASAPPEPLVSGAPAAVLHGDAMVPAASAPLAVTTKHFILDGYFYYLITTDTIA